MHSTKFYLNLMACLLTLGSNLGFSSEVRPVYRSTSSRPLTIYSVKAAELVDDYFDPGDPSRSYAIVRLTGVYDANCTSVELSARMDQTYDQNSSAELITELSLNDVSGPLEAIAVEPKICSLGLASREFDVKLHFQPNYFDKNSGERRWRVKVKHGLVGGESVYEFLVTLNGVTGFALSK